MVFGLGNPYCKLLRYQLHVPVRYCKLNQFIQQRLDTNCIVLKLVSDVWQVGGFLRVLRSPPRWFMRIQIVCTNKAVHHDIAEILLKVTLNTINQTNKPNCAT